MDASQYKDYVLVLFFIKYISDKYAGVPYAPIRGKGDGFIFLKSFLPKLLDAEKIAVVKGIPQEELGRAVMSNASELFKIPAMSSRDMC